MVPEHAVNTQDTQIASGQPTFRKSAHEVPQMIGLLQFATADLDYIGQVSENLRQ